MLRRPGIGSFGGGDGGDDAMAGGGFGVVRVTTHSLVDSSVVFEQTLTAEADEFCIFKPPPLRPSDNRAHRGRWNPFLVQWILTPGFEPDRFWYLCANRF
jgi:hypothetical protein